MPLILNVSLQETFGAAFDFRFLFAYFKRVGLLMLFVYFLWALLILPLSLASVCCFIIGPLFINVLVLFANAHLQIQIYNEYLRRGGTPIPLKPEPPTPAFPVIPSPPPGNGN